MTTFIYCPRSGDRIFAAIPTGDIVLLRWGNGCTHVIGGTHLSWSTAAPRQHWRLVARALATRIVESFGGVAWDENGCINLIVPSETSGTTEWLMRAARARTIGCTWDESDDGRNQVACIIAGTMLIDPVTQRIRTRFPPASSASAYTSPTVHLLSVQEDEGRQTITVTQDHEGAAWQNVTITAPSAWGGSGHLRGRHRVGFSRPAFP